VALSDFHQITTKGDFMSMESSAGIQGASTLAKPVSVRPGPAAGNTGAGVSAGV
jgi:hypothetical protein